MAPPLTISAPAATASPAAAAARAGGGLGSLVDADLARETAQLRDLHNRQCRRAAQTKANRAPQTLLSLFGDA